VYDSWAQRYTHNTVFKVECWFRFSFCAFRKDNRVIGMIRRTIAYKEPRIMLSLYKTLVRPHVEYTAAVRGIRLIRRTRNCWKRYSTDILK